MFRAARERFLQFPVPAGWDHLRPDQFISIAHDLNQYSGIELKAHITWTLLDISWRTPGRLAAVTLAFNGEERLQLTRAAEPFLVPDNFYSTPLPTITAGKHTLVCAHADLLEQVDTEIWGMVDVAFLRYNRSKDPDMLRAMAQALYALPGVTRAQRINNASEHLVKLVPIAQLHALHTMWAAHRKVLEKDAPWVFRPGNEKKAARRKAGWRDVMLAEAGAQLGDYSTVCMLPARVFLRELSHRVEHRIKERHEREAQRNRRGR